MTVPPAIEWLRESRTSEGSPLGLRVLVVPDWERLDRAAGDYPDVEHQIFTLERWRRVLLKEEEADVEIWIDDAQAVLSKLLKGKLAGISLSQDT